MITAKQRSILVEAIKTGKVPRRRIPASIRRRNLFKKLFALIGEPDKYLRIGFSDGPRGKENEKHRVVLVCRPSFELTDEKLAKLKEYVTINCIHYHNGIYLNAFNVTYSYPNWPKIDREIAGIK